MHGGWNAGGFTAEEENIVRAIGMVEVAEACPGREQDQAALGLTAPALECRPVGVPHDLDLIQVIHAGPSEGAVGGRKSGRLDDVRLDPQTRRQAQDRARVLRNVRLIERDPHGYLSPVSSGHNWRRLPSRCRLDRWRKTMIKIMILGRFWI